MNQVLQTPLPLGSGNPFSTEQQECLDHIGPHANHHSYSAALPDPLRREEHLGHSQYSRGYPAHRPDPSQYSNPATAGYSDSGSGSISTSPGSSTSGQYSFAAPTANIHYSNPGIALTNHIPNFWSGHGSAMSSARNHRSSITESPASSVLPLVRSPGMGNPVSPSLASTRDSYTTSTPGLTRHIPHSLSPRHSDFHRYDITPRVLPTTMPLPNSSYGASAMSMGYVAQPDRPTDGTPPFNQQETYCDITCEGTTVTPTIDAKIEKGFFFSADKVWTCYRRNYFAVSVSYALQPSIPNGRLYLNQGSNKEVMQIQSMAVSLAAAVDNSAGKSIELIQHTPKRDKGPQLPMKKELLAPTPHGKAHDHAYAAMNNFQTQHNVNGPMLPLQAENDNSQQYNPTTHATSNCQHSFERIQFKSATANNGKRRAQQQYYHLIVELWANIQNARDENPLWVKVAQRTSFPVVVRGRSPSHYHNEGPQNPNNPRGSGGSGVGGPGHLGLGSNGRSGFPGYSNGLSHGATSGSGGVYRGNMYSLNPSPVGSHSVSSTSSLSGGPVEGLVTDQHMVNDDDTKMMDAHDYQYYPAPIYETIPPKPEGVGLPLPERRVKEEHPGPATITTGWQGGGCGRYQGLETSRGLYPDVHTHAGF